MPWNDNANPGPWGSPPSGDDGDRKPDGPRRPPGGGPRGPRGPGPDLNAGIEQLRRRFGGVFGGGGGGVRPGVFFAIGGAAVALWMATGFYQVQPSEIGVVTTFGAFSRSESPGLHYRLPSPIEAVERVQVTTSNRTIVGGGGTAETDVPQESLMLTADENIIDLNFSVFWKVSDAQRFLFSTRKPEDAVKAVAESAMREVVGKTQLQPILTTGRGDVQQQTAALMQRTLDAWGAAITITDVQISNVSPPQEVNAAFRDVQSAEQDRDSAVNEANGYRNKVVQEAKGDAARIIQSAQAYKEQSVREATGDTSRFNAILGEYRRAPQATRDRLYLEAMERVLEKSNKVVVSGKGLT
ncbi:MAG TPA: FtsH protease activity modulator HflK, partial [Phenylobacterium sp.]